MSKLFYDHLISIDEIITVLDTHVEDKEERKKIIASIDEILHHHILDTILSHLPREHHDFFLDTFTKKPHSSELLIFIKEKSTTDIEREIKQIVNTVTKQLLADIRESIE